MTEPLHVHFEDLEIGQVIPLGACAVDAAALDLFAERFQPGWDVAYGAPEAMVYALWSRLAADLDTALLEPLMHEIALDDAIAVAPDLLAGQVRGRLVVRVGAPQ